MIDPVRDLINALDSRRISQGNLQDQSANFASSISRTFAESADRNASVGLLRRQLQQQRAGRDQLIQEARRIETETSRRIEAIGSRADAIAGQVQSTAFGDLNEEEQRVFEQSPQGLFFLEQDIQAQVDSAQQRLLTPGLSEDQEQRVQDEITAANLALQRQQRQRQEATGLDNDTFAAVAQQGEFQELFENRDDDNFNPFNIAANIGGGAVEAAGGLGALLASAAGQVGQTGFDLLGRGLGSVADVIGQNGDAIRQGGGVIGDLVSGASDLVSRGVQGGTGFLADLIDEENLDATVQSQRIGQAVDGFDGTLAGAGDVISESFGALNTGGVVGAAGDIASLLLAGGPIAAGLRGVGAAGAGRSLVNRAAGTLPPTRARAATAAALDRAGRLAPISLGAAGTSFQGGAVNPEDGDRGAQALTQLAGAGLLSLAGGVAPRLFGGVEGAVVNRAARPLAGTRAATPRTATTAANPAGVTTVQSGGGLVASAAERAAGAGLGFLREAPGEALQEAGESFFEQGAAGVADPNQTFASGQNLGETLAAATLGATIGGGFGAGTGALRQAGETAAGQVVPPAPEPQVDPNVPLGPVTEPAGFVPTANLGQPFDANGALQFDDSAFLGPVTPNPEVPASATPDFDQAVQSIPGTSLPPIQGSPLGASPVPATEPGAAGATSTISTGAAASNTVSQPRPTPSDDVTSAPGGIQPSPEASVGDAELGSQNLEALVAAAGAAGAEQAAAGAEQAASTQRDAGVVPQEADTAVRQPVAPPEPAATVGDVASDPNTQDIDTILEQSGVTAAPQGGTTVDNTVDNAVEAPLPSAQPLNLEVPARARNTPSGTFTNTSARFGRLRVNGEPGFRTRNGVRTPRTDGAGDVVLFDQNNQPLTSVRGLSLQNLMDNIQAGIDNGTLPPEIQDVLRPPPLGEGTAATVTDQPLSSQPAGNATDVGLQTAQPGQTTQAQPNPEPTAETAPPVNSVRARIDQRTQRTSLLNDNQNPQAVTDVRRGANAQPRLSASQVRRQIARSVPRLTDSTQVLTSTEISPELELRIREDVGTGFASTKAIVYRDQLIINRDNIEDEIDLEVTVAHEVLGHIGLRARHGPDLEPFLQELGDSLGGVDGIVRRGLELGVDLQTNYAPLIARAGNSQADRNALTEELVAGLAQQGGLTTNEIGVLDRLGAAVARWLRQNTPVLSEFLGLRGVTNVELAQFVSEASKAGRDLVDRGQGIDTVRAFALTDYSTAGQLTSSITQNQLSSQLIRDLGNSIGRLSSDLATPEGRQRRSRAFTERRRRVLLEDNAYTRFKRSLVDNRERLQAFSRRANRIFNGEGGNEILSQAARSVLSATNSSRFEQGESDRSGLLNAGLLNVLKTHPSEDVSLLTDEQIAQRIKERADLNNVVRLREAEAGETYLRDTQVVRDDLNSSLKLLERALQNGGNRFTSGVSQRTTETFFNSNLRHFHAIERNNSFYFNPTKNRQTLRQILGKDNFRQLRALYNTQFRDGANETQIAQQVEQFTRDNILPPFRNEFDTTYAETRTIGLTTAEAEQGLRDSGLLTGEPNFDPTLLRAFDHSNLQFQALIKKGDDIERSSGMGSVVFDRALRYNNFTYYYPHYSNNNPDSNKGNTDYMSQYRYADRFVSEFGVATGDAELGVDALISGNHQVERKYASVGDNRVGERVGLLWAASQSSEGFRGALGLQFNDATLRIVNKNSSAVGRDGSPSEWLSIAGQHDPQTFLWHLPPGLSVPGRDVEGSAGNSDQYVAVITFPKDSEVPLQIKGRRERSATLENLQRDRPQVYNTLRLPARTIGAFHTRYNFLNYPTRALARDGIQAFATVGAAEGLAGTTAFTEVGIPAATRDAPKIAEYLWHRSQTGQASADRLAQLDQDPELKDFVEFVRAGGFTANARSFSLEARHDELTSGIQGGRVLQRGEREAIAQVDQSITMLSIVADALGRYATYKTYRDIGHSVEASALEAKALANFEQRGESKYADIGALFYTFFRPSIIGTTQIIDSFLDSEFANEAIAVGVGMGGALFALGVAMSPEDDEGNNKFLQQGSDPLNFRIFLGDDVALQIPYGYNAFTALTGMSVQALFGLYSDQKPIDTLANMFDVVTNNLSPVTNNIPITDSQGNLSIQNAVFKAADLALPTFLGTGLGLLANQNNFGSPITDPPGALYGAGSLGRVYNANTRQVGGISEALTRGLFEQLGLPFDVRQTDFLLGELASGPRNVIDSAFEAYRVATGQDYTPNLKRLSLGVGGFIASPFDRNVGRYYDTLDRVRDISLNRRSLVRSGYTEEEAETLIEQSYGEEEYERLIRFENLDDDRVQALATEAKSTRLDRNLTSAERIERGREISAQQSVIIRDLLSSVE